MQQMNNLTMNILSANCIIYTTIRKFFTTVFIISLYSNSKSNEIKYFMEVLLTLF